MKIDRHKIIRRGLDVALVALIAYVVLLMFGVVRRGGQFEDGTAAPDFKVMSVTDGSFRTLDSYKGKTLLLDFFSTSCPSCKRELPEIEELKELGGDRLEVLVVSADPPAQLRAYLDARQSPLTGVYDPGGAHLNYRVDTIPYLVLIDPEGKIRADYVGGIRWSDIEPWLP